MNIFLWALVLWFATCTGSLSARSRIFMSVSEGSSVVLPCVWRNKSDTQPSKQSPYIEWRTISGTVFERLGEEQYQGEGYEGRVDVPEDNLKMGNCSLKLKDIKPGDSGVYESYLWAKQAIRTLQGERDSSRRVFIQSVELSVEESSPTFSEDVPAVQQSINLRPAPSSDVGLISVPLHIITFTILTNTLLHII